MPIKKGDYVLASKWSDGSTHDQWAVGFYDREVENGRHLITDNDDNQMRHNGFRKVANITSEEGKELLEFNCDKNPARHTLWKQLKDIRYASTEETNKRNDQQAEKRQ